MGLCIKYSHTSDDLTPHPCSDWADLQCLQLRFLAQTPKNDMLFEKKQCSINQNVMILIDLLVISRPNYFTLKTALHWVLSSTCQVWSSLDKWFSKYPWVIQTEISCVQLDISLKILNFIEFQRTIISFHICMLCTVATKELRLP